MLNFSVCSFAKANKSGLNLISPPRHVLPWQSSQIARARQGKSTSTIVRVIAFALMLLCSLHSGATALAPQQLPIADGQHGIETVRFRTLGVAEGLLQASVSALVQDASGMVWLGTQEGLFRFDGISFKNFRRDPQRENSLADNFVVAMAQDAQGKLWISSQSQSLSVFDPRTEQFVRVPVLINGELIGADELVVKILPLQGGRLLLGTRSSGVVLIDSQSFAFLPIPANVTDAPSLSRARPMFQAAGGDVIVGTPEGVSALQSNLSRVTPLFSFAKTPDFASMVGKIAVVDVLEHPGGGYWVGTNDHGLLRVSSSGALLQTLAHVADDARSLSDNYCRDLLIDARGRLWVATSNGLNRLNPDGKSFQRWSNVAGDAGSLPGNRITSLMQDSSQQLWVGTWSGGPALHDLRAEWLTLFQHIGTLPSSIPSNQVGSLALDSNDQLWLGLVDSMGLARFDQRTGLQMQLRAGEVLKSDDVSLVRRARAGGFWVGSLRGGLVRVSDAGTLLESIASDAALVPTSMAAKPAVRASAGLSGNNILSLLEQRDGTLWVGTLTAGLNRRCAGCTAFEQFRAVTGDATSIPGDTVTTLFEASAGDVYFGFRRAGLARYIPQTRSFVRYQHSETRTTSLSHNSVSSIAQDAKGRLWVGTQSGGLNVMNTPGLDEFQRYSNLKQWGSDSISCLKLAGDGSIWASITGGLLRIDPSDFSFRSFAASDGVQGRDFFTDGCARGADGRLYFGGLHGVTAFDPLHVPAPLPPAQAEILEFRTTDARDDKAMGAAASGQFNSVADTSSAAQTPTVGYQQRWFGFSFGVLDFRSSREMRYKYRLRGLRNTWIESSAQQRFAPFTNVGAGAYVFEVKAAYPGREFGPIRGFALRVEQAPWETPLAKIAYTLAGLGLVALMLWPIRARLRDRELATAQLEESQRQLKMVLASSGCELWRFNVADQTVQRESVLRNLSERGSAEHLSGAVLVASMHPEDQKLFMDAMAAHIRGHSEQLEVVYRMRSTSNTYVWLRTSGHVLKRDDRGLVTEVSGTTVDITELKQKEQDLAAANAELSQQINELTTARENVTATEKRRKLAIWGSGCEFFEADLRNNKLVRENPVKNLLANDIGDSLEMFWHYLHPEDIELFSDAFLAHVKGRSDFYDVTYRSQCNDGSWTWLQTRGRAIAWDSTGRATMISGTNYDVSDLKRAESELKLLADELEDRVSQRTADLSSALEALRSTQRQLVESEKMAALGGLVAGVAHEINTPLGIGVTAASHLGEISAKLSQQLAGNQLKKSDLEYFATQSQAAVELVMANLRRASDLVKSFKQVAVDQSSEQRRLIELKSYIGEILNSLRPTLKRHRFEMQTGLSQSNSIVVDVAEEIHMDSYPGAIYQVVSNLVLNALTHAFELANDELTPREIGAITALENIAGVADIGAADVRPADARLPNRIHIAAQLVANDVCLTVQDNGIGMESEVAKRIFDPFFTTKRGQGGSGLGLNIAFNLVTNVLGGVISVNTAPGQGATFTVRVPRVRVG
jgi:ligand-binding sensor domain-containing protein/signal transduction histidine kinase